MIWLVSNKQGEGRQMTDLRRRADGKIHKRGILIIEQRRRLAHPEFDRLECLGVDLGEKQLQIFLGNKFHRPMHQGGAQLFFGFPARRIPIQAFRSRRGIFPAFYRHGSRIGKPQSSKIIVRKPDKPPAKRIAQMRKPANPRNRPGKALHKQNAGNLLEQCIQILIWRLIILGTAQVKPLGAA